MVNDKAMGYTQLQSRSDEELCACAASGSRAAEEILAHRYYRLVRSCARPYFLAGGDSEDLLQEGMLGLLKAIREYDPGRDAAFRTFADTCIRNRLCTALRTKVTIPIPNTLPTANILPGRVWNAMVTKLT